MTPDADHPTTVQLRAATRESHERLEQDLAPIWNQLDHARYTRLLGRWYGFIAQWETAGAAVFNGEWSSFFDARRKLPLLAADLRVCGLQTHDIEQIPSCAPAALPFADPSAAVGLLYVIEGSTLGGQILSKQLQSQLGYTPESGGAYFSSYGKSVMPMWQETKRVIDVPPFQVDRNRLVQAAVDTFDFLGGWLRG